MHCREIDVVRARSSVSLSPQDDGGFKSRPASFARLDSRGGCPHVVYVGGL
jgi:hypothetical protein